MKAAANFTKAETLDLFETALDYVDCLGSNIRHTGTKCLALTAADIHAVALAEIFRQAGLSVLAGEPVAFAPGLFEIGLNISLS